MGTVKGKIVFFNPKSKFGFIQNYEDSQNYYVHERSLLDRVEKEDEVEFELKEEKRGKVAVQVKKHLSL